MRVLSLGAGVQSSTLLLMAIHGEIEIDRAIFADTQWEPRATYDWLGGLILAAGHAGIPVDTVTAGNLREDALSGVSESWMPLHIINPNGGAGMARRQCTKNYKLVPIRRRIRELVGSRGKASALIGISLDEAHRMKPSGLQWLTNEYPLVERRMTRQDCMRWLERHSYSIPPKSSCIGCPYKSDSQWRALRDETPVEWDDAVAFDASPAIRSYRIAGEAFLHRSLTPLATADLRPRAEREGQMDLFAAECEGLCGV
jgi:hypothetical protein